MRNTPKISLRLWSMKSLGKLNFPKSSTHFILITSNPQVLDNEYFGNWVQLDDAISLENAIVQIKVTLQFRHCC